MKPEKFCKLFDSAKYGQILVTFDYDSESEDQNDRYFMSFKFFINEIGSIDSKLWYKHETTHEEMLSELEKVDLEIAEHITARAFASAENILNAMGK